MEPFWEETYRDDKIMAFGNQPNQSIVQLEPLLKSNARILDVGCGDGTNVLYLASRGFHNTEGFDFSENGIVKLNRIAKERKLSLNAWRADLTQYQFERKYDLITSFGTLHFVKKDDWQQFIQRAKEATLPGGYNIMQIFTNKEPASPDIAPFAVGLADDGEIKELYADWEIIEFSSYVFEEEHPNVPLHKHASNKVVARKKSCKE